MLLSLKSDHKQHLQLLTRQSVDVLVDFCKLSIDFLHNGPNNKLYNMAANKLNVDIDVIQNCIYGLVNLLLLSCKHCLSEADFRDSLLTIGFRKEHQSVLYKFYQTKASEISEILKNISLTEPHFNNLEWRFEVIVSDRTLLQQVTPLVALDLTLNKNGENIEHHLLQTDPANLLHICNELDKALQESNRDTRKDYKQHS